MIKSNAIYRTGAPQLLTLLTATILRSSSKCVGFTNLFRLPVHLFPPLERLFIATLLLFEPHRRGWVRLTSFSPKSHFRQVLRLTWFFRSLPAGYFSKLILIHQKHHGLVNSEIKEKRLLTEPIIIASHEKFYDSWLYKLIKSWSV